jgi:hypothetical protein
MKYTYEYKTSDEVRHEALMNAASREEVFTALRAKGIKAIKEIAADGSKANGEVRDVRKCVVSILLALIALGVDICAYLGGAHLGVSPVSGTTLQTDQSRRQIIGDTAIIEKRIMSGRSDVFDLEGERFLASIPISGVKAGQRNTSEKEFTTALQSQREFNSDNSPEVRQIKAMAEGIKKEARRYLAAGGSAVKYGKRLTEYQDIEIVIYNRIKADLEKTRKCMTEPAFMTYSE